MHQISIYGIQAGVIILRDSNDLLHTAVDYTAAMNNKTLDLSIKANDTRLFGNDFGTFDIKANNSSDTINLNCYHNSKNAFNAVIDKDGKYAVDIFMKNSKQATLREIIRPEKYRSI
jgi:hypothetical protein